MSDAEIERILRESKSVTEAARKLSVHKSTASRWLKALGPAKTSAPAGNVVPMRAPDPEPPAEARTDAEAWAEWIRERYELTASEEQLLGLAVLALRMAHDEEQPATVRVQSMGRFQQLLKQLDLEGGG